MTAAAYKRGSRIGADLTWADLSGANLSWANLTKADLSGADLTKADLSGANLSRANLGVKNQLARSIRLMGACLEACDWVERQNANDWAPLVQACPNPEWVVWLERSGLWELVRENEVLRSNSDHLSSENASLAMQVESMAMRIESLAEELAKPEDVRLREVVDALDGRAVIFDGLGARVGHLLDEMDEWIARAGEAERRADEYDAKLTAVRVALTEAGVPEVEPYPEEDVSDHEKSLRAGGRVIGAVARIERLVARLAAAGDVVKMARQLVSYDWEARLDDSKTSDAAKHDARELSYAVYKYDRAAKS